MHPPTRAVFNERQGIFNERKTMPAGGRRMKCCELRRKAGKRNLMLLAG
jgi:hypothetical protein